MTFPLFVALVAIVLLYVVYHVYRRLRFVAAFKFPGPPGLPIFGNSSLLLGSRSDFFRLCERLGKENPGGVFQLWVGMRPFVFLYNSSSIKPLVTSSTELEKNMEYTLTDGWLGNGLITSKGEEWQRQRKMLTNCFHFNILKEFSAPVWKHGNILLDKIWQLKSTPFDFVPLAKLAALDIISETAMGVDVQIQVNSNADYPTAVERMSEILAHRFITPWMKSNVLFRLSPMGREYHKHLAKVHEFCKTIIHKKKKDLIKDAKLKPKPNAILIEDDLCQDCNKPTSRPDDSNNSGKCLALLDYLLKMSQENDSMTEEEIMDQVNNFMFAGHDTISCAISFTLFALGHHPEWQDAIIQELDEECPDILSSEPESKKILKGLPVLERCVKEAMRLYPPSPIVGRNTHSPLETPSGTIPAGSTAIIYTYLLHRDPCVFEDPDTFNPDRFLPQNVSQDSFSYIPFSAGPRNCIGKTLAMIELKTIVAMIIRCFQVKCIQKESDLDLSFEIVLTSPRGINLQFIPR